MESAAEVDNLTVITPGGERCGFEVVASKAEGGGQPRMKIDSLIRRNL